MEKILKSVYNFNIGVVLMPSHKIHLAIAKKVNEKLKLDQDSIMLGSILPDTSEAKNHAISHYQKGEKDLKGLANPDLFIKDNKKHLNNPVIIGMLIHILTDRFYNNYMFTNFYLYDESGNGIGIKMKNKEVLMDAKMRKHYKQREFWLYDKWLLNHNLISKFKSYKCINNVINTKTLTFNKEKIKRYIESANKDIDGVNIFSKIMFYNFKITDKQTLDKIFNECIEYILKYLKDNKVIGG